MREADEARRLRDLSMEALVQALVHLHHRGRRTVALLSAACLVSAIVSFAGARWLVDADACRVASELDSWNDKRRAAVEAAFIETGSRLARDTWPNVGQDFDAFAEAWSTARRDASEATIAA
jgi:hypothetical protein